MARNGRGRGAFRRGGFSRGAWLVFPLIMVVGLCAAKLSGGARFRPMLSSVVFAQQIPSDAATSRNEAKAAVRFLFPEQISVAAGKQATADLHFRIAAGLHINSHTPHGKTLIPTNLVVVEEPGVRVASVDFPAGKDYSFSFAPEEKVSIYSDEFVLRAHLTAARGEHLLQGALRYQACDSNSCYPPKTIPVAIDVIAK